MMLCYAMLCKKIEHDINLLHNVYDIVEVLEIM